jgi:glycosyltransferase involved in cell wall biosynthesis
MRILLVSGSYPPMRCGVGDYAAQLAGALARHERSEVLVLTSKACAPAHHGAGIEMAPVIASWNRRAMGDYRPMLRRFRPDILHIQFPTQGYDLIDGLVAMAFLCRFIHRIPVVVTLHEYLPTSYSATARLIYALAIVATRIIVVRPDFRERIPSAVRLLLPTRKFDLISNASVVPRAPLDAQERAAVRRELGCGDARLVAFFGFMYEHKGVDLLFQIGDPERHHLLLIGALVPGDAYHARLKQLAESEPWRGKVTFTDFVQSEVAARLLAAADAVVLPYRTGGGTWNSSLHAALSQDSFVMTASRERNGYDESTNVYFARPEDVREMRAALLRYQDRRLARLSEGENAWREIACRHVGIYQAVRGTKPGS